MKWKRSIPLPAPGTWSSAAFALLLAAAASAQEPSPRQEPEGSVPGEEAQDAEAFQATGPPSLVLPQPELGGRPREGFSGQELGKVDAIGQAMESGEEQAADGNEERDGSGGGIGSATLLRGLASLGFVLALILFAFWALKRFGRRRGLLMGSDLGREIGRVHLTPKAALHYVKTGDRVLVVGVTQNEVRLVTELPASAFPAGPAKAPPAKREETAPPGTPFQERLRENRARLSEPAGEASGNVEEDGGAEDLEPFDAGPPAEEDTSPPLARDDDHDGPGEDDIESLRGDIERLQQYLQDTNRGAND